MSPSPRTRLDALLVARGLTESREKARALVLAGRVHIVGHQAVKAGLLVRPDVEISVDAPEHPWVGRGGIKLDAALRAFAIEVSGRLGVDIGASTGGFTDVLLQRGARHVVAIDVGHNQLHWKLRSDARVTLIEGLNARFLSPSDIPLTERAEIVTVDVSFISLKFIVPRLRAILAPGGDIVLLVKPQFEAGRDDIERGGLVRSADVHARVLAEVTAAAAEVGLTRLNMIESPITGADGNREFLMHLRPTSAEGASPTRDEVASPTSEASLPSDEVARPTSEASH